MASANSPYPRWKALIANSIKDGMSNKEKSVLYYVLGTVDSGANPSPHLRTVVHRGFVNEQRSSSSNTGVEPFDKRFGSNSCLVTTTDVRAPKAQQIMEHKGQARGEICWWFEGKQLQLRLAGSLHILPDPSHPAEKRFDKQSLAPPPVSENGSPFDWEKERSRIFEKMSPELLASFTRPNPSGPHPHQQDVHRRFPGPGEGDIEEAKSSIESPWKLQLPPPGQEKENAERDLLREARKNFALLLLNPDSVDVVDLARDRRSIFTTVETRSEHASPNSQWKEERLVP